MTKHEVPKNAETVATPGPWIAIPSALRFHSDRQPIFDDGIWHILPEANVERMPIATVDKGDDHDAPTRARAEHDARLIAAAPELYAALAAFWQHFDNRFDGPEHPYRDLYEIAQQARAAIAKATGAA